MKPSLQDLWRFVVVQRLGYRQPSPVTKLDDAKRRIMDYKISELQEALLMIDTRRDVYRFDMNREERR